MTKATVNEFRKFFGYQPLEDRFGSMRIEVNFPNRHDDRIYLEGLIQKEAMMHIEQQLPQVAEQMNEIFALSDREDWTIDRWLRCTLDIVLESGGGPSSSGVQIGDCSRFDRCRMRLYQGDRPCNNWQLLVVKGQELLDLAINIASLFFNSAEQILEI